MADLYEASIPFLLNAPAPAGAQVDYATAADTAVEGDDYMALSGTHVFAEGDTQALLKVTTRHPYIGAPAQFRLNLTNPVGIELAAPSLDVILPGITRRTLFLDTFTADGAIEGRVPDIGVVWTEYGGGGLNPLHAAGGVLVLEDDGTPDGDSTAAEGKLAEPITPGAGVVSVRLLINTPTVNPDRGEQLIDFEAYSSVGNDWRFIILDWKDNTAQIGGNNDVNNPGRVPFDLSGLPAQFTAELRWDVDGLYTGLYIEGEYVMGVESIPITQIVDYTYFTTNGIVALQIDNYIVEQGVPDAVDPADNTPPLLTYMSDTFSDGETVVGHFPDVGNGNAWSSFNHSAAGALTIAGGLASFEHMAGGETMGAQVPATLPPGGLVKLKASLTTLPSTGQFLMGLANSPMIGQSYTGAQVKLDFAEQAITIQGTYDATIVPFPVGWTFVNGALDFEMVVKAGEFRAVARLGGLYAGEFTLESTVGAMYDFMAFFNASACPDLRLTQVTTMQATPAEYA